MIPVTREPIAVPCFASVMRFLRRKASAARWTHTTPPRHVVGAQDRIGGQALTEGRPHSTLVILSDDRVFHDSNGYRVSNPSTRLYGELTRHFGHVIVSGPVTEASEPHGYHDDRVEFRPRPGYGGSVLGFLLRSPWILPRTSRSIGAAIEEADVVLIRVPSPVGILGYWQARRQRKPYAIYIIGDIRAVAGEGGKYRGPLMRPLASFAAWMFHRLTHKMCRNTLVFAIGSALVSQFEGAARRIVNFWPSLISSTDIQSREDACRGEVIRILFVGRLVPVKGLPYLLEATRTLLDHDVQVEVSIVGTGRERESLIQLSSRLGLGTAIRFLGELSYGPDLLAIYRRADVFVLPSLSEAMAKTVWEAMACGVPVVATRIGGLPDVVRHEETGLLVDSRRSGQIADAIERLCADGPLRQRLIKAGYSLVSQHTIEKQATLMGEEIKSFFGEKTQW